LLPEPGEFLDLLVEIILFLKPLIKEAPNAWQMIDDCQVGPADELEQNRVGLGHKIVYFDLRLGGCDPGQSIADTACGRVMTFSKAGGENEDFLHGSLGEPPRTRNGRNFTRVSIRSLMDICPRQSKLWPEMNFLRSTWRVVRRLVWETATDTTTGLAAQMAYLLLFALAPGLFFFWHLIGLFGTDPAKLHRMFVLLKSFMPPDAKVQDILDIAMASVVVTGSSGMLANVGIILGIYFGTVFIATISRALSHTHGVHEDRHWWSKYIISFFMLFWFGITILVCFNAMVFGERLAGVAEVNFQLSIPLQTWFAYLNLPFIALALIGLALALYLLTPENYLTIRQALPGAIFFSIGWIIVTKLFQYYVVKYNRYNPTYLALASIIMLLTWMYLTCLLLLVGGKLNAILQRERERHRKGSVPAPVPETQPA
jgi:membrane protein